jgi:lipoate-protein ligase B
MSRRILDLDLIDYEEGWNFQKKVFAETKAGDHNSTFILCRHHPVITLGRVANKENILAKTEELNTRGIRLFGVERGGDVTYHGPGQLTLYPVLNLSHYKKDIHWYLRSLEDIAIKVLTDFGVCGTKIKGKTGVWVGDKKIASVGVTVKNWITYHGLSINIKKGDLANFSLIRPCGMDIMMTSLESAVNKEVELNVVKTILIRRLRDDQSCFA